MPARCPTCNVPLTIDEARQPTCPVCGESLEVRTRITEEPESRRWSEPKSPLAWDEREDRRDSFRLGEGERRDTLPGKGLTHATILMLILSLVVELAAIGVSLVALPAATGRVAGAGSAAGGPGPDGPAPRYCGLLPAVGATADGHCVPVLGLPVVQQPGSPAGVGPGALAGLGSRVFLHPHSESVPALPGLSGNVAGQQPERPDSRLEPGQRQWLDYLLVAVLAGFRNRQGIGGVAGSSPTAHLSTVILLTLVADALTIVAGLLAIAVVWSLRAQQEQKFQAERF